MQVRELEKMNITICLLCTKYFVRDMNPKYLVLPKLNQATEFFHMALIAKPQILTMQIGLKQYQ